MNAQEGLTHSPYILFGIELNAEKAELTVDSTKPKAIPIRAVNELTGEVKNYMLRVTSKGGLCLV